jgi:uncharacterized lipoprotein
MKKLIAIVLLLAIIASLSGCSLINIPEPEVNDLSKYADPESVKAITLSMKKNQARRNGDTYCKRCDKFIEGKVEICIYCGQYI